MNDLVMSLNQGEIVKAWFTYTSKGIVREDLLRPVIARSWERSPKLPYKSIQELKPISKPKLQQLRSQNSDIIKASELIFEYLFSIDDDIIIVLCDKEGYAINSLHKYKNQVVSDMCYSEDEVGCNTAGIILKEGRPESVCGFEHLTANWHTVFSSGVPLKDAKGNISGVITVGYPFGKRPQFHGDSIQLVGNLVEECWTNNYQYEMERSHNFNQLINFAQAKLMVVDTNGMIVNVNNTLLDMINTEDKTSIINEHLSKIFDNRSVSLALSDCEISPNTYFNYKNKKKSFSLQVEKIKIIQNQNGYNYKLIIFRDYIQTTKRIPRPKILSASFNENDNAKMDIFGKSPAITSIKNTIKKVCRLPSTVLILGESGTGKELVARSIHSASGRKGSFVPVNCGAIPRELLESELFGYDEGTFTGAKKGGKSGKFETANGGTLFLDEIGEMPMEMQVALLRFLEDKTVIRMGSTKTIKTDVRIIAATNRNLLEAISKNIFREDLYYRLNVINLYLPPLREIKEDISLISKHILKQICIEMDVEPFELNTDAVTSLCNYNWPGNVRELRNILERAVVYTDANTITSTVVEYCLNVHSLGGVAKKTEVEKSERDEIIKMLERNNWNVSQTAKFAGISRKSLYDKLKNLKIDKN